MRVPRNTLDNAGKGPVERHIRLLRNIQAHEKGYPLRYQIYQVDAREEWRTLTTLTIISTIMTGRFHPPRSRYKSLNEFGLMELARRALNHLPLRAMVTVMPMGDNRGRMMRWLLVLC